MMVDSRDDKYIEVGINEDLEFSVRWADEAGESYVLTDARCQVRKDHGNAADNPAILDLSVGDGITLSTDGWADVHVPAATVLANVQPGRYRFDIVLTRSDEAVLRPMKGLIIFDHAVTFPMEV